MEILKTTTAVVVYGVLGLFAAYAFLMLTGCSVGFQASPAYPGAVTQQEILDSHTKTLQAVQQDIKAIGDWINKNQAIAKKQAEASPATE